MRNVMLTTKIVLDWRCRTRTLLCLQGRNIHLFNLMTDLILSLLGRNLLLTLLEILTNQFFCLFLHYFHSDRALFFSIHLICFLYHCIILLHFGLVLCWKNSLKSPQMLIFILIPESLSFRNSLLPFFSLKNLSFACQQSLLIVIFGLIKELILCLHVNIQQFQRILDQIKFYKLVQRSICRKARSVIHLQKNRLSLSIHHNIQPQNMKTH